MSLNIFKLRLRCLGPVFIGSGEKRRKVELIFDEKSKRVYVPNLNKLVACLARWHMLDAYERFVKQPGVKDLREFLTNNRILQYSDFCDYSVDMPQDRSISDVSMFIKDCDGLPYIPGSSLKGALRTVIAAKLLDKNAQAARMTDLWKSDIQACTYMRKLRTAEKVEQTLLRTLQADTAHPNSAVNDVLRGLKVSDSKPVGSENLILCKKQDRIQGKDVINNKICIYRECLKPGTELEFIVTLETALLGASGIDEKFLLNACDEFDEHYYDSFESKFAQLHDDADVSAKKGAPLYIGGGAGYPVHTLTYKLFKKDAVALTRNIMESQFRGKHGADKDAVVSPHTLKLTRFNGKMYTMGKCEVTLERMKKDGTDI